MRRIALAAVVIIIAIPVSVGAEIANHGDVPANWLAGSISGTLTAASPGPIYYAYGDLTVPGGSTLTIDPGVTIQVAQFSDFLASGAMTDKVEIIVYGTLNAVGSVLAPITFVGGTSTQYAWGGFRVESYGTLVMSNASIQFAVNGVYTSANAAVALSHVTACPVRNGFVLNEATGSVQACDLCSEPNTGGTGISLGPGISTTPADSLSPEPTRIRDFYIGADLGEHATVSNLLITQCHWGVNPYLNSTVNYCTIVGGERGLSHTGNSGIRLYNSIIMGCGER